MLKNKILLGIYTDHFDHLCANISSKISLLKQLFIHIPNMKSISILPLIDHTKNDKAIIKQCLYIRRSIISLYILKPSSNWSLFKLIISDKTLIKLKMMLFLIYVYFNGQTLSSVFEQFSFTSNFF